MSDWMNANPCENRGEEYGSFWCNSNPDPYRSPVGENDCRECLENGAE